MTIFWDTKEQEWCEGLQEDVQFFHSIVPSRRRAQDP